MTAAKYLATLGTAAAVALVAACADGPTAADRSAAGARPGMHHATSSITGPNPVTCTGNHTYDSNPGGGGTYTYNWSYKPHGDTNYYYLANTRTATQWIDVADTTMTFRVDVTTGGHTSTSYKTINGPISGAIC